MKFPNKILHEKANIQTNEKNKQNPPEVLFWILKWHVPADTLQLVCKEGVCVCNLSVSAIKGVYLCFLIS